jgi:hypothetical protein
MQRHHRKRHLWMWGVVLVLAASAVAVGLSVRTGDQQPVTNGEVR